MKYIDADKLIAEIDKKWKELADKNVKVGGGKYDIEISAYLSIKNLITSFQQEQPEVDLEKELEEAARRYKPNGDFGWGTLNNIAYYFYELGLKARKK